MYTKLWVMTFIINNKKNIAIVYCRISRIPDAERGVMSLDSQEFAIKRFLETHKLGVFSIFKNTGSAFKTPQTELKTFLKTCKNKILVVFEPNRLSRSILNFTEIAKICIKNKHKIAIVSMNSIFDMNDRTDYNNLKNMIEISQRESEEMGRRISRSYQYKKSREPVWGKMRDDRDRIIDNPREQKINLLIRLLGTKDSNIEEIRNLVNELGVTENKEPFEIVYHIKETTEEIGDKLPEAMSIKNIIDTLKIYEIKRRRRLNWTNDEITTILSSNQIRRHIDLNVDNLCNDFNTVINSNPIPVPVPMQNIVPEWIKIWYVPSIGLPPGLRIPEGMTLPTTECEIWIPKM